MATLQEVLQSLDPPIKHELLFSEAQAKLYLIDTVTGVVVERQLLRDQCERKDEFGIILIYAVNELRLKGCNAPLPEIPQWTGFN